MTSGSAADFPVSIRQHTVGRTAQWRGERRRRRTDVLVVHPAEADTGVRFLCQGAARTAGTIAARWDTVVDTRGGIVLGNTHGVALRGVTPLLAALRVAGIDNVLVEVQGSRIPAEVSDFGFYLDMLTGIGAQAQAPARQLLCMVDTVEVRDRFGFVALSPAAEFRACVNTTRIRPGGQTDAAHAALLSDFTEPHAGFRAALREPGGEPVAPAREICALPETARGAVIELIGHLALAGAPLAGRLRAHGSGPGLYQTLLHAVMERRAAALTTVDTHRARGPVADPDAGS